MEEAISEKGVYQKEDPKDSEGQAKPYTFDVYRSNRDGSEVKFVRWFENVDEAVRFAKMLPFSSRVIFNPNDNNPATKDSKDNRQSFEYPYNINPFEVVWDSYKPKKKIKQLVRY